MKAKLLDRITFNPHLFGGKPIIRGRRLAVEHILGQLAAGDTIETLLEGYHWLEREDVLHCRPLNENFSFADKFASPAARSTGVDSLAPG